MEDYKEKTSFAAQLSSNYDELTKKLQKESTGLKSLETFFKEHSKLTESYAKSLLSLLSYLRSQPGSTYSLQTSIFTLTKELEEFAEISMDATKGLFKEVVRPLELFKDHFDKQYTKFVKNGNGLLGEITEARRNAGAARDMYMKNAAGLEKVQGDLRELIESAKESSNSFNAAIEQKTTQALDLKLGTDNSYTYYKKSIEKTNELIETKYDEYYMLLDSMLQLEESRVDFVKGIIKKHLDYMEHVSRVYVDKTISVSSVVEYVNSQNDLRLFVNNLHNTGLNPLFIPMECVEYKPASPPIFKKEERLNMEEEYFGGEKGGEPRDIRIILDQTIIDLMEGKPLSLEEKATVIEQLHKPTGKDVFAEVLSNITRPVLVPTESFKVFGELVSYLLTAFVLEKDYNSYILTVVLNASRNIHTKMNGKNMYLFSELAKHGVWQEMERWKGLIKIAIEEKIEEAKLSVLQRKKYFADLKGQNQEGIFKKLKNSFISGLGKVFAPDPAHKEEAAQEMHKATKSAVTQVLGQFVFFFSNLHTKFEKAQEILRYFGNAYGLDPIKIYEMELTLKASQPFYLSVVLDLPKETVAQKKCKRKLGKFGNSLLCLCIGQSLPYISDLRMLRGLLLVNKRLYSALKVPVFKRVLLELNIKVSLKDRLQIWLQILDLKNFAYDYELVKEKLQKDPMLLPKATEDLIAMDVMRSMPENKLVNHSALSNILRVYACYNKKVEYCQGMNFIAGYLYLLLRDEALVFKFLVCLIEKYNMKDLFTQDVPLLKRYFYQIDRLFYLHCPEISEYFRSESVNASFFTSAWFITLFTYSVQHTKEETPPPILLRIWDAFLLDGWKALFKVGIFIVKELEGQLLDARFDDVMIILGGLPRSNLMQGTEGVNKLTEFLKNTKVTNTVLEQLDKEYNEELESVQTSLGLARAKSPLKYE